jgi:hypothetical protein
MQTIIDTENNKINEPYDFILLQYIFQIILNLNNL